jgi:arylsulfatase A-like enzyme
MNVILILIDSLNRHALSAYGPSTIRTPNLDSFARRAWRFDKHFVGSLPCMPARREIFSGRRELMWRPWGPLEPHDARLPRLLEAQGYATAIVTDHYHYWEESANGYIQSFQTAELVRGHEIDFWKQPLGLDEEVPGWVEQIEVYRPAWGRRYYANVQDFKSEEDFFPAKVMSKAAQWLDENARRQPFFLQIESFDVHEPFHVPEPYLSLYTDERDPNQFNIWPPYQNPELRRQFFANTTPAELDFIRAQYAGKVTMVDRWLGEVLQTLDRLALWEDTAVIITTDHGHDLGEREAFGKQFPHYDSHANIPLFVWHPQYPGNGQSVGQLTSTVDLFASVLDTADTRYSGATHSRSVLPLLRGDVSQERDALLYGTFGQGVCITDGEWTLIKSPQTNENLNYYSTLIFQSLVTTQTGTPVDQGFFIPNVPYPQWQIPAAHIAPLTTENFLFHRAQDPQQVENLWDAEPAQRARLTERLRALLQQEGAPPEQYVRLGL